MLGSLSKDAVAKSLVSRLGKKNVMQVPRVVKVCLNMGIGISAADSKVMDSCTRDLAMISAQKPVVTRARKSIAGFKIRKGFPIGCMVTLRGKRMYEFLDRLINIALPRERDFRGLSTSQLDGHGNISFGIKEHISFLEVDYDKIDKVRGLDVVIVTTATNDADAKALLLELGFPFMN
ncbi:50S ribosomal protein L5 [Anaplasma phagocytophilum]|uniref:Large ribosomal subunit protein uL5 n=9 Tax=Anaplasma phagocytophilum TaxID=948 RepID=RL5_ANAPZ|nr:50S ribosomal protein L5 [Anaplasma phagocytophilum]Q2GL47.1 RecName: Full=Large ribosomal subunit protein uL5; AltName: Full=50S ribosomal protein L5 [Anaplasma phagocytophilum str. HZ]KJV63651.1 50S ribosomal protein L5 [Anaplasma phagocytophilum str. ApMUC09]KJV66779.1 50S ribosomal protein L5 [Anaplasma phagocytophilum str. ApNP]ABD43244.1 ribosomal protein L5 [Anaplasma phagocytophilum str. HZ]AGR78708.1 50S ribosomal protein L5 [Anaplasma phagocytophilum str. HZ2]AGR79955.1 50S ribos